jgi:hypothetical protein
MPGIADMPNRLPARIFDESLLKSQQARNRSGQRRVIGSVMGQMKIVGSLRKSMHSFEQISRNNDDANSWQSVKTFVRGCRKCIDRRKVDRIGAKAAHGVDQQTDVIRVTDLSNGRNIVKPA